MDYSKENIMSIEEDIKNKLSNKRYLHSMAVAGIAASLAMNYGENVRKAYVAGLLHDYAKEYDEDNVLDIAKRNNLSLSKVENMYPKLIHGKIAAIEAKKIYEITDEDLLNSLRFHTSGRVDMSLLEKIIFLADYIDPHRKEFEGINEIRHIIFKDINLGMYLSLRDVKEHLKQKNKPVIESSDDILNYYHNLSKNKGV